MEKPNEKQTAFIKGLIAGMVLTLLGKMLLKSFK